MIFLCEIIFLFVLHSNSNISLPIISNADISILITVRYQRNESLITKNTQTNKNTGYSHIDDRIEHNTNAFKYA